MFLFVPVQTYLFKRDRINRGGKSRPEARFLTSMVAVWLFPISLFWFAFTSNGKTSFWSPVIAGGVLGFANPLLYLSMLNYVTGKVGHPAAYEIDLIRASSNRLVSELCCFCSRSLSDPFIHIGRSFRSYRYASFFPGICLASLSSRWIDLSSQVSSFSPTSALPGLWQP